MIESTAQAALSSAEICRRNGWRPGTELEADPLPKECDRSLRRIRLTAVGAARVLALDWEGQEHVFELHTRDWRAAAEIAGAKPPAE